MPAGDEDNIVDKAIGNPAFDQLFGYHIFFRRAAIPFYCSLIGILSYTMIESLFLQLRYDTHHLLCHSGTIARPYPEPRALHGSSTF